MKMKKILVLFALILGISSCVVTKYVPLETNTEVHIKDSTIYNYIDSIRIHEATRYRDFSWIGDTLKLNGNRSRAWAVADTLKGAIIGEIEEDPVEEKTKIIYKDRIQYRDSIRNVEVPVPVEVEKKVTPKLYPWSLGLNLFLILTIGMGTYFKFFYRK